MKVYLANLDDLITERRSRDKHLVWITKNGEMVPIREMSDSHLNNTINMLERKKEENYDNLCGLTIDFIS